MRIKYKKKNFPAFIAKPARQTKSGVILIHEIWGLTPHIRDVAGRLEKEGYTVLAPDLMFHTPLEGKLNPLLLSAMKDRGSREEARKRMAPILSIIGSREFRQTAVEKLKNCFSYLRDKEKIEKIAAVGFCFGGTYCFELAANEPALAACIPFYGHAPSELSRIKNITCPMLAFYGERDRALVSKLPELKEAMEKYNKQFEAVIYPGCGHAFFNDTNPDTFNKKAAEKSWRKMLGFLDRTFR